MEKKLLGMYVIYDKVAEEAGPIFECKNDGVARRAFAKMLEKNYVGKKLEYELFKVGETDKENMEVFGKIELVDIEYGEKEDKDT